MDEAAQAVEFVFRFNRRTSANRGLLFFGLCQGLVTTRPYTQAQLLQRRPDLQATEAEHAWRLNQLKNEKRRDVYRVQQEQDGKTVRPYNRRASAVPDPDDLEEPF